MDGHDGNTVIMRLPLISLATVGRRKGEESSFAASPPFMSLIKRNRFGQRIATALVPYRGNIRTTTKKGFFHPFYNSQEKEERWMRSGSKSNA